jgi:hypothetical protein
MAGGLWMFCARGGVAWTRDRYEDSLVLPAGPAVDPTATVNRTGWTVGGGVEWAFAPQWSVDLEANYYEFGTQTIILTNAAPVFNVTTHIRDSVQHDDRRRELSLLTIATRPYALVARAKDIGLRQDEDGGRRIRRESAISCGRRIG